MRLFIDDENLCKALELRLGYREVPQYYWKMLFTVLSNRGLRWEWFA